MRVAFDHPGRQRGSFGVFEDRIYGARRKDSCKQRADGSSRAVDAEGIERVVVAEARLDLRHHQIAEHTGNKAYEESGHWSDKPRCRSNGYQPGNGPGDRAQSAGLAIAQPLSRTPS